MKTLRRILISAMALSACACGQGSPGTGPVQGATGTPGNLVQLNQDLSRLRQVFNEHRGQVRLLFVVGPSCGICLRGMADLNDALVAPHSADDRLFTFVAHVPALGATEEHARDAMPLLAGPRVAHYRDATGIIGRRFQDVLDLDAYAWDIWLIYGPDATWDGDLPPAPDHWEHQLPFLSQDNRLDAERFAAATEEYLDGVSRPVALAPGPQAEASPEVVIPCVAQPIGVALETHIRGRGGYQRLKRVSTIEMKGRMKVGDAEYTLQTDLARPASLSRRVTGAGIASLVEVDAGTVHVAGDPIPGLPADRLVPALEAFEFDGNLVEWKDKGHRVGSDAMVKAGDVLGWRLRLRHRNGQAWDLLVDSHTGDLVRAGIGATDTDPGLTIELSDYRWVDGLRFPFHVAYEDVAGNILALEFYSEIRAE